MGGRTIGRRLVAVVAGSVLYRLLMALALQSTAVASDLKAISAMVVAGAMLVPVARDWWGNWRRRRGNFAQEEDGTHA